MLTLAVMPALYISRNCGFSEKLYPNKLIAKIFASVILPLLIFSAASTRLHWYIYPIYPFLALLLGVFLAQSCALISQKRQSLALAFILCAIGISLFSEMRILRKIHTMRRNPNPIHAAMAKLGEDTASRNAILFFAAGKKWQPSDHLAAMFYGDFTLMDGTYEAAKDKRKIFILNPSGKIESGQP